MTSHPHDYMIPPVSINWESRQRFKRILCCDPIIENLMQSLMIELCRAAACEDGKPVYLDEQIERIARIRGNIDARQDVLFAEFLASERESL